MDKKITPPEKQLFDTEVSRGEGHRVGVECGELVGRAGGGMDVERACVLARKGVMANVLGGIATSKFAVFIVVQTR